jgi:uncharacterized membrane protein YgdD (TMEM256/DUF423 family)
MSMTPVRLLMATTALLLAAATALGAIGSHAFAGSLDPDALHAFETAVEYQFIHALGLLAIALYLERQPSRLLGAAAMLLLAGILLFCGGVYASSLDGPRWIARLAPTGGVSLIAGWLLVAFAVIQPLFSRRRA